MKKMKKIDKIWIELENEKSFSKGLLFRRYSGSVAPEIFVALKSPEKYHCIAALIKGTIHIDIEQYANLKDITIEILPDKKNPYNRYLLFILLNSEHKNIFSVLCEDLLLSVSHINNEIVFINEMLNRFEKWKSLFDKISLQGLSPEEQRGLWGELYLLRKLFNNNEDFNKIIMSWVGIEKGIRDFQFGDWSVEVKTTHGKNHQVVHISNELQLDTTNLENLYVLHLSIESRQQSGETLNSLVDSIRLILQQEEYSLLTKFNNKLLEAGYFENNKELYSSTGYFVRDESFYKVEDEFPRIEENDIRVGVGNVKYSILLSQCKSFKRNVEEILRTFYNAGK